jgi:uncharacterized phage protein (TIGR01671 family)
MDYGIGIVHDGHWRGPVSVNFSEDPLMQYTGLKDKNGREIYEGDIVKWGHNINTLGSDLGVCFDGGFGEGTDEVMINECGVWLGENKSFFDTIPYLQDNIDEPIIEFEVIGNIYENHELIGDK